MRHYYLDPLGRLKKRRRNWRNVGTAVLVLVASALMMVGAVVAIVFLISGATL